MRRMWLRREIVVTGLPPLSQHEVIMFKNLILIIFTEKLRKFYFTKGAQDQFWQQNIQSVARDVLQTKSVKGTSG